jgi:hypothetical protein
MSTIGCGGNSLFGPSSQYIKTNGGDFISIEGANIRERLILSDLRIPYKQILKSRIILKAGQVNYLLNHLGLGDNATFLAIKATYDAKSVIEADNYVIWNYYNDFYRNYYFAQMMVLTGNSTNRVQQIYLSNPNTKYPVYLDVMVAVIDDNYSFFTDTINQSGRSFVGLEYTDIKTHIIGESIVINDKSNPPRPLVYIMLVNIQSIERVGNILTIYDSSLGPIFLQFLTEFDAVQAQSLINYVLENPSVDIDDIDPLEDLVPPIIFFNSTFNPYGDFIALNGATYGVPYNSSQGVTFSTSTSLYSYGGIINKTDILNGLIDIVTDNRDGAITLTSSSVVITDNLNNNYNTITATGSYIITFNFSDIATNSPNVLVNINVI